MWEDTPLSCAIQRPLSKPDVKATDATLRDYFAAAALQGECARMGVYGKGVLCEGMVARCYDTADAMIAERSKRDD